MVGRSGGTLGVDERIVIVDELLAGRLKRAARRHVLRRRRSGARRWRPASCWCSASAPGPARRRARSGCRRSPLAARWPSWSATAAMLGYQRGRVGRHYDREFVPGRLIGLTIGSQTIRFRDHDSCTEYAYSCVAGVVTLRDVVVVDLGETFWSLPIELFDGVGLEVLRTRAGRPALGNELWPEQACRCVATGFSRVGAAVAGIRAVKTTKLDAPASHSSATAGTGCQRAPSWSTTCVTHQLPGIQEEGGDGGRQQQPESPGEDPSRHRQVGVQDAPGAPQHGPPAQCCERPHEGVAAGHASTSRSVDQRATLPRGTRHRRTVQVSAGCRLPHLVEPAHRGPVTGIPERLELGVPVGAEQLLDHLGHRLRRALGEAQRPRATGPR